MRIIEKLGRQYKDMSEIEKRVYRYMMKNVKGFSLKSIGNVAEELDISKTTLMRFAKSIGYNGYSEFKKALQEEELLEVAPAAKLKKWIKGDTTISAEKIQNQEIENIHKTFVNIDKKKLEQLVDRVASAPSIYSMGWGMSSSIADIFTLRMRLMGINATTIHRKMTTLVEGVSNLHKKDLLIVFELQPYVYEVLDAVSMANCKGIDIVLVTDKPQCPLIEFASFSFFCGADTEFFGNSLSGLLFWVNLVTSEVIYRMKDKVMDSLENQREIFKNTRYYIP